LNAPAPLAAITAAGNPVMESILLGVSPEPLSRVPYRPAFTDARRVEATALGFNAPAGAMLYAFPLIGGFVGGDAVAVALSLGLGAASCPTLAIDIGTNSEILLSAGGNVYATSAAAGPAFEGGELKYGMTAQNGAIQGVKIAGDSLTLDVIGGVAPVGICGSGLIEAVSELIRAGVIERTGRIKGRDEIPDNLSSRIREERDGNSFILYRGPKAEVSLTQPDIRALQTAKSSTRAGVLMLLKKAGITASEVRGVYIAGAFGSRLEKGGLKTIGLLDEGWLENVSSVGDAALAGAVEALRDEKKLEAEELARRVKYVPLSGSQHFEKEFIKNMNF
ncbi:MAG TPA: ASKHA domain-containing protein, partial [Thermodesulfobacteriota bacterium]|nr:ASKHA domain-containing protein [Thermodesulfobacteriota bacterium]